jgi:hypothetical protein
LPIVLEGGPVAGAMRDVGFIDDAQDEKALALH